MFIKSEERPKMLYAIVVDCIKDCITAKINTTLDVIAWNITIDINIKIPLEPYSIYIVLADVPNATPLVNIKNRLIGCDIAEYPHRYNSIKI